MDPSSKRTRYYVTDKGDLVVKRNNDEEQQGPSKRRCTNKSSHRTDNEQNENEYSMITKPQSNVELALENAILEKRAAQDVTYYDKYFGSLEYEDSEVESVEDFTDWEFSVDEDSSEDEMDDRKADESEEEDYLESEEEDLEQLKKNLEMKTNKEGKSATESKASIITPKSLNSLRNTFTFVNKESMNAFVSGVSDKSINPFFGRSVKFMVTRDTLRVEEILSKEEVTLTVPKSTDNFQRHFAYFNNYNKYCRIMRAESLKFWNEVAKFLGVLGKHIWEMTIIQEDSGLTPVYLLEILTICLRHTPNLKKLVVDGSFSQILAEPKVVPKSRYARWASTVPAELQPRKPMSLKRSTASASAQGKGQPVQRGSLWWHPLVAQRMLAANTFLEVAPLPKLPNLKAIELNLKEYLPEYIKDKYLSSTQGYSICNYIFLKHKKIMSAKWWCKFPAVTNVSIKFEKCCMSKGYATDLFNSFRFLPFQRTWVRNDGGLFEESEYDQRMNPIPRRQLGVAVNRNRWEFVRSFRVPEMTAEKYAEENKYLYIPSVMGGKSKLRYAKSR